MTPHAKSNAREGDGVAVTDAMIRQFVDGMGAPYCFDAPPPSAIRAGLAAALQAQQGAEPVAWQPIETAPKDGTPLLAWWPPLAGWPYAADGSNYAVAQFRDHQWRPAGDDDDTEWDSPTHWQPLPAAPATGAPR